MSGLEHGIRWRRSDGSTYDRFSDDFTEKGARQMVAACVRLRHHKDDTLAVAALVRDVSAARLVGDVAPNPDAPKAQQ